MSTPLLAAKLIELRHLHGYSQQEVADYLDLTREGYSHYERNAREPNLETLVKLSHLYHVDIAELINDKTVLATTAPLSKEPPLLSSTDQPHSLSKLTITQNLNHLLKILTGKNSTLDLTSVSKEDLTTLFRYKQLDASTQQEVQDFINFKFSRSKKE